jgi:TetR/AcrR family tetracycline transcriptional repressor
VRLNTVSWHVKTKGRLLELMADSVLGECSAGNLPADPQRRVRTLVGRYREALLAHRDGARLVAGTFVAEKNTLDVADEIVRALLDCGHGGRSAAWTCWTLVYFTLGIAQEEQAVDEPLESILRRGLDVDRHSALNSVVDHLLSTDFDARFEFGLNLILAAVPGSS